MAFTLETVQDDILAYLGSAVVQDVLEQGFPDIETVPKGPDGKVVPYYSVRFGDTYQSGAGAMAGAYGDDYRLQLTITAVAPTPEIARRMSNKIVRVFLGKTFDWAGQIRKRWGGGMLSTNASNSATEAYAFPSAFDITVQFAESD